MRTQSLNPAVSRFNYLLPKSGRYPVEFVDIFWNRDNDGKVKDVEVVFIPRRKVGDDKEVDGFWDEYAAYNKRWESDLRNSCSDWLQPGGQTPEGIFGYLLGTGFSSPQELERALEEFAHIEKCAWAREMLKYYRE
jgi:hypothetical protein